MATALINGRVLTATGLRDDLAVLIEDGRIAAMADAGDARVRAAELHDLVGHLLLPGFIDIQVNGGGGVLFNDAPTVETMRRIGAAHRRYGTTGFLPTLISDDADVMRAALAAVDAAIEQQVPGVLGVHLEGPYIAPARRGAHDPAKFRVPDAQEIDLVCSLRRGVTVLTLAPEQVSPALVRELVARGVIVCIGHTAASYEDARAALAARRARFYPFIQCNVAAARTRARRRRRGAGRPRQLVRHHRRRPPCPSRCVARGRGREAGRQAPARHRCDAAGRRRQRHVCSCRRNDHLPRTAAARPPTVCWPDPRSTWHRPCAIRSPRSVSLWKKPRAWPRPTRPIFSGLPVRTAHCRRHARRSGRTRWRVRRASQLDRRPGVRLKLRLASTRAFASIRGFARCRAMRRRRGQASSGTQHGVSPHTRLAFQG